MTLIPKNILALDFETSQATRHKRACQIGLTPIIDGIIQDTKEMFIQPPGNKYDPGTQRIHHITPQMTANEPTFKDLWPTIKKYFDDADVIVSHSDTERCVLENEFDTYGLGSIDKYHFDDTLALYRDKYNKGNTQYSLGLPNLCKAFHLSTDKHHQAGDDSRNCAIIYLNYLRGIEPDMEILEQFKVEPSTNFNSGQFQKKEQYSLEDFIDVSAIKPVYDCCLSGKRIIVTREFTIYGRRSKDSESIIREYLKRKFNAETKKGQVCGTTDYVFLGELLPNDDWNKGQLKKIKYFQDKKTLKGIYHQDTIDKLFAQEKRIIS